MSLHAKSATRSAVPCAAAILCLFPSLAAAQIGVVAGEVSGSSQPPRVGVQPQNYPQQGNTQPTTVDHLHGVVVNALTGRPVSHVLVLTGDQRLAVFSDFEGRFTFDLRRPLPPGEGAAATLSPQLRRNTLPLNFVLRRPGFVQAQLPATLPLYTPTTPDPEIQLKITPAALLTGQIATDTANRPANLNLQLQRKQVQDGDAQWVPIANAHADSSGEFRFPDLEPGDYKLFAPAALEGSLRQPPPPSGPGFLPVYYPESHSPDEAGLMHLGPGETASANLSLHAVTFQSVTIPLGSSIDPTSGISAFVLPQNSGLFLIYNARAGALQGLLPPGSWDIRVNGGNGPQRTFASLHVNIGTSPVVTAPAELQPGFTLPVHIHRDFTQDSPQNPDRFTQFGTGRPLIRPSVDVLLRPDGNPLSGGGANAAPLHPGDDPDTLELQNVGEGTYRVVAFPTMQGYIASMSSGQTDLLGGPLVVGPTGSPQPIEITLRNDGASVNVSLLTTTPPQSPDSPQATTSATVAQFASILCVPIDEPLRAAPRANLVLNASFSPNGPSHTELSNLAPGRYLLIAFPTAPGRQLNEPEYRNPVLLQKLLTQGVILTLSAGQKVQVQVPLVQLEELTP